MGSEMCIRDSRKLDDALIEDPREWYMGVSAYHYLRQKRKVAGINRPIIDTEARDYPVIDGEYAFRNHYLDTPGTGETTNSRVLAGHWLDCVVTVWGGIEFIIDDRTRADGAVTVHAYLKYDVSVLRPESFITSNITGF